MLPLPAGPMPRKVSSSPQLSGMLHPGFTDMSRGLQLCLLRAGTTVQHPQRHGDTEFSLSLLCRTCFISLVASCNDQCHQHHAAPLSLSPSCNS